jgi:hypothetical protein
MTDLSPAALAIWEAFNEDEAGVFVDYGDKLAAALRAAADQVVPEHFISDQSDGFDRFDAGAECRNQVIRDDLLAIAAELEGAS